jgi:hypothetical protein
MILKDHIYFQHTAQHYLYDAGELVLSSYDEVLRSLWHTAQDSTSTRLQNALAAAIDDIDPAKFQEMDEDDLADLRSRCGANKIFQPQTAPPLVVFLGHKRPRHTHSSPSTAIELAYADEDTIQIEIMENEDEFDGPPWSEAWEENQGPWVCNWGWNLRDKDVQSFFIFLSGGYVVWPRWWQSSLGINKAFREQSRLDAHLKVTLFHELVNLARSTVRYLFLDKNGC